MLSDAIRLEHITKQYRTGQRQLGYIAELVQGAARSLVGKNGYSRHHIKALDDVSFSVKKGERVAIIGQNGSGKSTSLKVIAGVTNPTSGKVMVQGSLGTLIEVTVGFSPELTGKENTFLNATIQGLTRKEVKERYDEIVEFSGLGDLNGQNWMETPVKWYSSGMYVRLGFSITTFLNTDILIVDEALAVGDAPFQAKCLKRLDDTVKSGKTLVFVSQSVAKAKSVCSRGIVLERGKMMYDGDIDSAARCYESIQRR